MKFLLKSMKQKQKKQKQQQIKPKQPAAKSHTATKNM